jgi:hypothetical protein
VMVEVVVDGRFEFRHRGEDTAPDTAAIGGRSDGLVYGRGSGSQKTGQAHSDRSTPPDPTARVDQFMSR